MEVGTAVAEEVIEKVESGVGGVWGVRHGYLFGHEYGLCCGALRYGEPIGGLNRVRLGLGEGSWIE